MTAAKRTTIALALFFFLPVTLGAQELIPDKETTYRAVVLQVLEEKKEILEGTSLSSKRQLVEVEILNADKKGEVLRIQDDYFNLETGDDIFVTHIVSHFDNKEYYIVSEVYRLTPLLFFAVIFILLVVFLGGAQGVRGLLALGGSVGFIFFLLMPGILAGYSPVIMSMVVASLIIILGSYITHGFNRTTTAAVFGMIATILITGVAAYIAVHWSRFTGFGSDEATYLNLNAGGSIDMVGLLLGGILIGLLGVLYDAGIGQAVTVEELHVAAPTLPPKTIYKRALRVGREHIGALVNTLALAYVGAALPLILLFMQTPHQDILVALNREIFSGEIMRIIIGSTGLILAVPITTFIAVHILVKKHPQNQEVSN